MRSNGLYPGMLSVVLSVTRYFMDCYFSFALALAPLLQLLCLMRKHIRLTFLYLEYKKLQVEIGMIEKLAC